jgi:hypothetical protein
MEFTTAQMYVTSHYVTLSNADVMKTTLLYTILVTGLLSSCSTAIQGDQTPDDVYYSPGREVTNRREEEKAREEQERYEEYISSQDDRYLRMKVANRSRWSGIDDFNYWYDSRYQFNNFNTYSNWNSFDWNNRWNLGLGYGAWRPNPFLGGWNGYYGWGGGGWWPGYTVIAYSTPKFYSGYTSGSNLSAYRNKSLLNTNNGYYNPKTGSFVNSNAGNNSFGNLLKRVFSPASNSNSSNNSSWDRPVRSFSNSSNGSSTAPSSNAGGNSGGVKSTGSSTSTGRGGRGN